MGSVSISAVIPVYNEAPALAEVLERADRAMRGNKEVERYEIILVDDGSTDGSLDGAALPESVRVLKHSANRGYGAALKTGIKQSKYPLIMICDADGSYELEAFPKFLSSWSPSRMVVASRDAIIYSRAAWIKRIMRGMFNIWMFFLTFRIISDINSGFRLFEKEQIMPVLDTLSDRFSFTTGLTLQWILSNKTIVYIPTRYAMRKGESKVDFLKDSFRVFSQTVRIVLRRSPARLVLPFVLLAAAVWEIRSLLR